MKFLNKIDGADKLVTDTSNRLVGDVDISRWNNGVIPNIGSFSNKEQLIAYVVTNQFSSGLYKTGIGDASDCLLMLHDWSTYYDATIISPNQTIYAKVSKAGSILDYQEVANKDISQIYQIERKVDNSRVLTDVPANAKFTDTVYSHPSTHPASMITENSTKRFVSDTEKSAWNAKETPTGAQSKASTAESNAKDYADVGLADKVDKVSGKGLSTNDYTTVEKNKLSGIATGANNYTHPTSHPASIIVESTSRRFVSDTEKSNWNTAESNAKDYVDEKVKTDVPANAKFTDTNTTYSEITTAEIDVGTASTGRTITGRRVKYILDKVSSMISSAIGALTKSSVGLGNVNNTSDASKPISTATQTALNGKVNNSQVLTNVPSGAKFTDTVTTINGKTGTISKADITALGIPAQDTVYTHPTTHPYSMITGAPTSLPASGGHALSATHLLGDDTRAVNSAPSVYMNGGARYVSRAGWQTEFKTRTAINNPPLSGTYVYLQTHTPWSDPSGGYPIQVAYGNGTPCWRVGVSTSAWSAWQKVSDGGDANTVNGFTVGVNVPSNAKFTDTVYSHPSSHPASMITESSTKRFVSDTEKSTWNSKSDTDTVTTINGKTGAISKADIVALGIPTSDTNTTYSEITAAEITTGTSSTSRTISGRRAQAIVDKALSSVTKSNVGLSNVDNLSAASIRSGTTKANVGLGNVDNTSDLAKPISTATQTQLTAIDTKINNLSKGGTSLFAGNGLEKTIPHGLGSVPTSAYAFPSANPEGYLGEVWVRFNATNIYVGNTGSYKGAMVWGVIK